VKAAREMVRKSKLSQRKGGLEEGRKKKTIITPNHGYTGEKGYRLGHVGEDRFGDGFLWAKWKNLPRRGGGS